MKLAKGGAIMITATATEMQNNFGRYLGLVSSGQEVIVTKNGREVGRFIPRSAAVSYLTDSLIGVLKEDHSIEDAKEERLREKYATAD
jgi:prevent-host-death family protein